MKRSWLIFPIILLLLILIHLIPITSADPYLSSQNNVLFLYGSDDGDALWMNASDDDSSSEQSHGRILPGYAAYSEFYDEEPMHDEDIILSNVSAVEIILHLVRDDIGDHSDTIDFELYLPGPVTLLEGELTTDDDEYWYYSGYLNDTHRLEADDEDYRLYFSWTYSWTGIAQFEVFTDGTSNITLPVIDTHICGEVLDSMGNPLEGVEISSDASTTAITDHEGVFCMKNLDPGEHILECSKKGYSPKIRTIFLGTNSNNSIFITMEEIEEIDDDDLSTTFPHYGTHILVSMAVISAILAIRIHRRPRRKPPFEDTG